MVFVLDAHESKLCKKKKKKKNIWQNPCNLHESQLVNNDSNKL